MTRAWSQPALPSSSSTRSEFGEYRECTIITRTLDAWAEALGQRTIQLVKIDVEGHEHAVIEGGRKTIHQHRPFIIVEILGAAEVEAIDGLLTECNYLDIALAPDALRRCVKVRFHPDAWNHLLCPAEKSTRILTLCRELNLRMDFV